MKRYTAAQARQNLSRVLDEAERGTSPVIERKGVQFLLSVRTRKSPRRRLTKPRIVVLDPAVEAGSWTWTWTNGGLTFRPRVRRRA